MEKNTVYKTAPINRPGLADIWNAFMVENATFSEHDIPLCPTTATNCPHELVGYDEAKGIHKDFFIQIYSCIVIKDILNRDINKLNNACYFNTH